MTDRDDLVEQLLALADQLERNPRRVPLSRHARWSWEPWAITPADLRRAAELLESGEYAANESAQ